MLELLNTLKYHFLVFILCNGCLLISRRGDKTTTKEKAKKEGKSKHDAAATAVRKLEV